MAVQLLVRFPARDGDLACVGHDDVVAAVVWCGKLGGGWCQLARAEHERGGARERAKGRWAEAPAKAERA